MLNLNEHVKPSKRKRPEFRVITDIRFSNDCPTWQVDLYHAWWRDVIADHMAKAAKDEGH